MTDLSVRGLVVRHRDSVAVDGVDVALGSGEQLVVLGSSGAGKTTLLHALLGAGPRVQGEVRVGELDPYDPAQRRQVRRSTGIVLQGGDLVTRMRARTAAVSGCSHLFGGSGWWALTRGRTPPALRERLTELADQQGVTHLLGRRVGELSGGERQRVGLLRALLGSPGLLLADEPTAGLDPAGGAAAVDALLAHSQSAGNPTLVVTTHDPVVAARFDRVLALRAGRVVHDGAAMSPDQIGELYARKVQ